ncbi:MAG TPA: phosphoribosylformylglycinamidine cyclo-ligase [Candidatus Limnocylindrales bacterium]|nr:phosphoribosylformylglycinamidine cyclo-ligase [Candidatus Limnocylindrales bacterium]
MAKEAGPRAAYTRAGVNVDAGEAAVGLMRRAVESTHGPGILGGLGGFGGAVAIPPGYIEPVLVSSTDGVGTKTAIAVALGRYDTIGRDLVAMCADDVVCSGAAPLFFLDYVAVGRLDPANVAELVGSVADGCREARCALVGGETAEHPGLLDPEAFDLAGSCTGIVERARLIDGSRAAAGNVVIGLLASGLHANGYSLIRALLAEHDLDLAEPYQARLIRTLGEAATSQALLAAPGEALMTLGEVLLTPTRIYAAGILDLRSALDAAGFELHGVAHITGGGLPGNAARMLPEPLGIRLDPERWPMPSVMRLFGALGGLEDDELRATFNGGLGMVVAVEPAAAQTAVDALARSGYEAALVGEVVAVAAGQGRRYSEGSLAHLPNVR